MAEEGKKKVDKIAKTRKTFRLKTHKKFMFIMEPNNLFFGLFSLPLLMLLQLFKSEIWRKFYHLKSFTSKERKIPLREKQFLRKAKEKKFINNEK
jgi:hypothetical protein